MDNDLNLEYFFNSLYLMKGYENKCQQTLAE